MKTYMYHTTLHVTPWALDLFIRVFIPQRACSHEPFRRIEHSVHIAQGHNIETMSQD